MVDIAYDQAAGTLGNATTSTAADEPVLTFNALGGLPCMTFPATETGQGGLLTANHANISQPYGIEVVWEGPTTNGHNGALFTAPGGGGPNGHYVGNGTSYWYFEIYAAAVYQGFNAAQNQFNTTQTDFNGTSGIAYLNGTSKGAQNLSTQAFGDGSQPAQLGAYYFNASTGFNGLVCEIGIWPASIASNAPALVSNQESATTGYNVTFPH